MAIPTRLQRLREQLLADPSLLAQKLDLISQRMLFVRMGPQQYRQASFLDDRILTPETQGIWVGVADVSAALDGATAARPLHFIFHAGHVGSTLVSRLLESIAGVLALREPLALRALADAHDALGADEDLLGPERFEALMRDQLTLWSRGYDDTRAVILKATSSTARLGPALLRAAPASRAIHLSTELEPYLATLLAGENSAIDLRGHAVERLRRLKRFGVASSTPLHALSAGELAALSWAAEELTAAALAGAGEDRVLRVDFEQLLSAPQSALRAIVAHFALDAPESYFAQLMQDPAWSRYAKAPELAYSPERRAQVLAESRRANADEIRKGQSWIQAMARQFPAARLPVQGSGT